MLSRILTDINDFLIVEEQLSLFHLEIDHFDELAHCQLVVSLARSRRNV